MCTQGLTSLGATFLVFTIRWPMWGGMLPLPWCGCRKAPGASEEDYYAADFSPKERLAGLHGSILNFVSAWWITGWVDGWGESSRWWVGQRR